MKLYKFNVGFLSKNFSLIITMLVKNYTKVILAAKKESSPFTKDDLGGNLL